MDHVGPLDGRPISVTHSHGYAGLVVGPPGSRVGIDLELEAGRDCASLAELAYAPEEYKWLLQLERTERRRRFHELWTLKEAFAKALSLDLVTALAQCRFTAGAEGLQAFVPTDEAWTATVCAPFPGYRLAVVNIAARPREPAPLHFVGAPGQLSPNARDFVSVKPRIRSLVVGSVPRPPEFSCR